LLKTRIFSIALALSLSAATFLPQTAAAKLATRAAAHGSVPARAHVAVKADAHEALDSADEDAPQKPRRKGNGFARALRALARLFGGGKKSAGEEAKTRKTNPTQTSAAEAPKQQAAPAAHEVKRAEPEVKADARVAKSPAREAKADARALVAAAPLAAAFKIDKSRVKTTAARSVVVTGPASRARGPEVESPEPAPELKSAARVKSVAPAAPVAPAEEVAARPAEAATRSAEAATRPSDGARVVRPDETGAVVEPPKLWIPVIEGISKDPLTQGRALLEHGYVQEAIAELSIAATQVGPLLVEANNLLGIAYDRAGRHRDAVEAYNRALAFAPRDANVIANLGYSLYLADDFAGALKRLRQAAKLSPGQPVIYNNLGVVLARTRKYEEAYKYFAIATNEYDAHLKLAAMLEDQGLDRDAVKHYEAALAMQPGASAVLERLVALYKRTGERDKADTARRALGRPKNPQKTTTGGGGGGD
jgi:tetratricopeptide (TPR) repeat protein